MHGGGILEIVYIMRHEKEICGKENITWCVRAGLQKGIRKNKYEAGDVTRERNDAKRNSRFE